MKALSIKQPWASLIAHGIKDIENHTDANNVLAPVLLSRDRRHSHFWIEDGELFESYHTIRGLRYRHRFSVNGLPDTDKCQPDMIKYIEAEYLS